MASHPYYPESPPTVTVSRRLRFNAAHRLHNPAWTDDRNTQVFGPCANPNYHGHNYVLMVEVTGPVDPETGYVIDLKELNEIAKRDVIEKLDHRNLNLDVPWFASLNPSAENIAVVVWHVLRPSIAPALHLRIVLHETENNRAEYAG